MDLERTVTALQQRVGQLEDELAELYRRFGPNDDRREIIGAREQHILDLMATLPAERSAHEIHAAVGVVTIQSVMGALKQLADKGLLVRSGQRRDYRYSLPGGK